MDFEKVVLLWTLDLAERDARLAHEVIRKWSPNNISLLEISCSRSSIELLLVRKAYHIRYKKSLEEDIASHRNGDFCKLLVVLASSYQYDGPEVDTHLAISEAKQLHEAIKEKDVTREELIWILSTRSKAQLNATKTYGENIVGLGDGVMAMEVL
eukprot:Gb_19225 [translate_table: standard]